MGGQGTGAGEEAQANGGRHSREFGLIGQQISAQDHWEQEPPKYLRVGSKLVKTGSQVDMGSLIFDS